MLRMYSHVKTPGSADVALAALIRSAQFNGVGSSDRGAIQASARKRGVPESNGTMRLRWI